MDAELEAALEKCRRTVGAVLPCYLPEYMASRKAYHELLRKKGVYVEPDLPQPVTNHKVLTP